MILKIEYKIILLICLNGVNTWLDYYRKNGMRFKILHRFDKNKIFRVKNKTYFCILHDHVTGIFLSFLSDFVQAAISRFLHNVNHV